MNNQTYHHNPLNMYPKSEESTATASNFFLRDWTCTHIFLFQRTSTKKLSLLFFFFLWQPFVFTSPTHFILSLSSKHALIYEKRIFLDTSLIWPSDDVETCQNDDRLQIISFLYPYHKIGPSLEFAFSNTGKIFSHRERPCNASVPPLSYTLLTSL